MPVQPYFQVMGSAGGYWWRLRGANHEIVAHSEKYRTKADCLQSIRWVKAVAPTARVVDSAAA